MNTIPSVEFNNSNGNFKIVLDAPTQLDSKREFKFITDKSEIKNDNNVYYLMTDKNFNKLITNLSENLIKTIEDKFILTDIQFKNLVSKLEQVINRGFSTANDKQSCTDTLKSLIVGKNITSKSHMMTNRRNLINYKYTKDFIVRYEFWKDRWKAHRRFAVSKINDKKPICFGPRADFQTKNSSKIDICSSRFGKDYTNNKYRNNTIFEHASFGLNNTSDKQKKGTGNFSDHKGTRIVNMGRPRDSGVDLSDEYFSKMLTSYYKTSGGHYTTNCSKKSSANPGGDCFNFEKYMLGSGYPDDTRNCNNHYGKDWKAPESMGTKKFATPLCSLSNSARYKKASEEARIDMTKNYEKYFVNGFMHRPVKNNFLVYEPRMEIYNNASIEININQTCCGVNMQNMDVKKMGDVLMDCNANQDITKNTTTTTISDTTTDTTTPKPKNTKESIDLSSNTTIIIVSVIGVVFFLILLFIIIIMM